MITPPQSIAGSLRQSLASSSISSQTGGVSKAPWSLLLTAGIALASAILPTVASDHSDVPILDGAPRQDANLTDLHAFVSGTNLVIALSSNPAIPGSAASYIFPSDVTFAIHIDNHSLVDPADPNHMGGTILDPQSVLEDFIIRARFDEEGTPSFHTIVRGDDVRPVPVVNFFAGLRDDPFIRGPRQGRNIASIVVEVPLSAVTPQQSTLLIWGTSKVEDMEGPFQDLVGRSLRSMMPENNAMNSMLVRQQQRQMGVQPDVMIFDTARPAAYPNGRALTDDVVDLVGDPRLLNNDAPFPSTNDRPFLAQFPYLAEPHPPQ